MSKNIVIQEGGNSKQFTASKLNTALVGGGSCNWVPEDETQLVSLSVSENGTYTASSEGHYGYSQVTVNVSGGAGGAPGGAGSSIIGTDTDGDTVVSTVEDDGSITTEKQVDRIRIGVMPTKTVYVDGEAIDVTGMTVMGLTTTGTFLKFIPLNELTISPAEADISQVTSVEYQKRDGSITAIKLDCTEWIDPDPNCSNMIIRGLPAVGRSSDHSQGNITVPREVYAGASAECSVMLTKYNNSLYCCLVSDTENPIMPQLFVAYYQAPWVGVREGYFWYGSSTSGRLVLDTFVGTYSTDTYAIDGMPNVPESASNPSGVLFADFEPIGGTQTITVSWTRPSDGAVLTTSFEITVNEEEQPSSGVPIEDNYNHL